MVHKTINTYLESILNPSGRFSTLNISPILGADATPVVYVKRNVAAFSVSIDGVPHLLKCFFYDNCIECCRSKQISNHTDIIKNSHLTSYKYLYKEMLIFDTKGEYHYTDVVIERRPDGEPLLTAIERLINNDEIETTKLLFSNLISTFAWLKEFGMTHGNIKPQNIIVRNNTKVTLINYDLATYGNSNRDHIDISRICLCCYAIITSNNHKLLCDSLREYYEKTANGITKQISTTECNTLFARIKELALYTDEHSTQLNEWDYLKSTLISIASIFDIFEDTTFVYDNSDDRAKAPNLLERYEEVGPLSDNLMRAKIDNKWYYLDYKGKLIIDNGFDKASDFIENRASVSIGDNWGLINQNGEFIIPAIYRDLFWDGDTNLAIAVNQEEKTGIINRMGEIVAPFEYDNIFCCSESLLLARKGDKYGYLNLNGDIILDFIYDDACSFNRGAAKVKINEKNLYIDNTGNSILD